MRVVRSLGSMSVSGCAGVSISLQTDASYLFGSQARAKPLGVAQQKSRVPLQA